MFSCAERVLESTRRKCPERRQQRPANTTAAQSSPPRPINERDHGFGPARVSRLAINNGDRQLRRTCVRFGEEIREIRLRAGVTQAALARAIGVSRSVLCRMEQGDPDVSARIRARTVNALGGDFRIAVYPGGVPLIHDAAHARIVEVVLDLCDPSWHPTVEAPVPGPGRRSTDIRLDRRHDIVLMEVETRVGALEAMIREGTGKQAAVSETAPAGQRVHVVLVLPSTRHHRTLVSTHPGIVAAAFPAPHDALMRALAAPDATWPGNGILWVSVPRKPGP